MLCWSHWLRGLLPATLNNLNELRKAIMATQAELIQTLKDVSAQQKKSAGEIQAVQKSVDDLKAKIVDLEAAVAAGGSPSQDLTDAVADVKAQAQVVDDLIPDAPTPVTVPAPTP